MPQPRMAASCLPDLPSVGALPLTVEARRPRCGAVDARAQVARGVPCAAGGAARVAGLPCADEFSASVRALTGMSVYTDVHLLPVPERRLDDYRRRCVLHGLFQAGGR